MTITVFRTLFLGFFVLAISEIGLGQSIPHPIKLNEIMYDPNDNVSNEFLELYNTDPTESYDLLGWTLEGVSSSTISFTVDSAMSSTLLPNQYAIILPQSYFEDGHIQLYKDLIPEQAIILKANKNISLNNSGDHVIIKNSSGETIVDFTYEGGGNKGYSYEKIIPTESDIAANYAQSTVENGTPGFRNSVSPFQYDLAISAPTIVHTPPLTTVHIDAAVKNVGLNAMGSGSEVKMFADDNDNNIPESSEILSSVVISQDIPTNDSTLIAFYYTPTSANAKKLLFEIDDLSDENPGNNVSASNVFIGAVYNSVIINEIMYAPIQNSDDFIQDQPDYIELYNKSANPIDLNGWQLLDAPNEHGERNIYLLTNQSAALQPGAYAVFSPEKAQHPDSSRLVLYYPYLKNNSDVLLLYDDSRSTFSLNNEGDLALLTDQYGYNVDSVSYTPNWHNPFFSETSGKSLERINPNFDSNDPSNWTTCTDRTYGGSPGKKNLAFLSSPEQNRKARLEISPNPFSPNSDGNDDHTLISFTFSESAQRMRAKIFDARGRLVQTLENGRPSNAKGTIIWDGRESSGKIAPIGIYIVLVEVFSASGKSTVFKKPVVLAQPLN